MDLVFGNIENMRETLTPPQQHAHVHKLGKLQVRQEQEEEQ